MLHQVRMKLKFEIDPKYLDLIISVFAKTSQIFNPSEKDKINLRFGIQAAVTALPSSKSAEPGLTSGFYGNPEKPEIWVGFDATVFKGWVCESFRNGLIDLSVTPSNLITALKSGAKCSEFLAKLGRAQDERKGILYCEYRMRNIHSHQADPIREPAHFLAIQQVPVDVLRSATEIKHEPNIPPPNISVELVGASNLKTILEKMKKLKIETVQVSITTDGLVRLSATGNECECDVQLGNMPIMFETGVSVAGPQVFTATVPTNLLLQASTHFSGIPSKGNPALLLADNLYLALWTALQDSVGQVTCVMSSLVVAS